MSYLILFIFDCFELTFKQKLVEIPRYLLVLVVFYPDKAEKHMVDVKSYLILFIFGYFELTLELLLSYHNNLFIIVVNKLYHFRVYFGSGVVILINFVKGIFIGIGGALPGLSGGALAAIFGIYEPIINFFSNFRKDTKAQLKFLLPIVAGGITGVFLLSHVLSYLLEFYLAEVSIFFVGCMLGIFPALVKTAGLKGRKPVHLVVAIAVAVLSFLIFSTAFGSTSDTRPSAIGIGTSVASGSIIGLGITFPGLSPSNFLMYLGLYQPINEAISRLNFSILIPVAIGGILSILLTAKLVSWLLKVAYTMVYHVILGLVLTSTVMIIPRHFSSPIVIALCLIAGLAVGRAMSKLEDKTTEKMPD